MPERSRICLSDLRRKGEPRGVQTGVRRTNGYGIFEAGGAISPVSFERRDLRDHDVAIRTLFCGVCHSDLHALAGADAGTDFPLVPGHEICGEVVAFGPAVSAFGIGERVLVGTIVDSCRSCEPCQAGNEQYCRTFPTLTYDGTDRIDGTTTRGGFSRSYVTDERFVYTLPANIDAAGAAPLLCAGVTTYSPLRHWNAGPGKTVGIVGIGGLGHLAIKLARAMGAHVIAFTTSASKAGEAKTLGAHETVLSTSAAQMDARTWQCDFILDTVSERHQLDPYLRALRLDGTLCVLGIPDRYDFTPLLLTIGRRSIASSGVGGTAETREMLAFCNAHRIEADIELIAPLDLAAALQRLERGDVRYRFVLDLSID